MKSMLIKRNFHFTLKKFIPLFLVLSIVLSYSVSSFGSSTEVSVTSEVTGAYNLAENSIAKADIFIGANASKAEIYAVKEIQDAVRKVSNGAELLQVTEITDNGNLHILIGTPTTLPEIKSLFTEDLAWIGNSDGFAIRQIDNKIYIFGNEEKGALNGVYDFLEENTGILWTRGVDNLGTLYNIIPTLPITRVDYREKSPFEMRGWNSCGMGTEGAFHTDAGTWLYFARNKINMRFGGSATDVGANLAFEKYSGKGGWVDMDIYVATHPEYFMTNPDGTTKMSKYGSNINFFSADVARVTADEIIAYSNSTGSKIADIGIQDNQHFMMHINGVDLATLPFTTDDGYTVNPGDVDYKSTVFYNYVNRVARLVRIQIPDFQITTMAYIYTEIPPRCPLEDNIRVTIAPIHSDDHLPVTAPSNVELKATIDAWVLKCSNIAMYNYYASMLGTIYSRPTAKKIQADLQYYRSIGIKGLCPEGSVDSAISRLEYEKENLRDPNKTYNMNQMNLWIVNQLFWDPDLDIDAMVIEFCDKAYGPASADMQEYYRLIQDGWDKFTDYVGYATGGDTYIQKFIIGAGNADAILAALSSAYTKAETALQKSRIQPIKDTMEQQIPFYRQAKFEDGFAYKTNLGKDALVSQQNLDFSQGPWAEIPALTIFKNPNTLEDSTYPIKVRIMWDEQNIYTAYQIYTPNLPDTSKMYKFTSPNDWFNWTFVETYWAGEMTNLSNYYCYFSDPVNNTLRYKAVQILDSNPPYWETQTRIINSEDPSERYWSHVQVIPFETLNVTWETADLMATFLTGDVGWCGASIWSSASFRPIKMVSSDPTQPDTVAPATTSQLQGTAGQNGWYNSDVTVTLSATDNRDSVVTSVYYSLDGGANFTPYTEPVVLTQSGVNNLQYYSVDSSSNVEVAKSTQVSIDKEAPSYKFTVNGIAMTGDLNAYDIANSEFKLSASETTSGISIQSVTLDGLDIGFESSISWAEKVGDHNLTVLVQDNAGNKSEASFLIHIIAHGPVCDVEHPHMIYNKQDLDAIRSHIVNGKITGYFKLANDIIFDDTDFQIGGAFYNNGLGWIPIGHNNLTGSYSGLKSDVYFDGAGFSITNMKMFANPSRYCNGFIAAPENSVIKNVRFYKTRVESRGGAGVVYGTGYGNTIVENVTIDSALILNKGGAVSPSGIFSAAVKGTAKDITIINSKITHINPETNTRANGWALALFSGMLLDNANVSNITITNSVGELYAYSALFATTTNTGVQVNNVSITDTDVTWMHAAYYNFLGSTFGGATAPNAGRENVLINNIYVEINSIDNNTTSKKLIPMDTGFKMTNAVMILNQSANTQFNTTVNPLNPDNLDNVFLTRKYPGTNGTVAESKNISTAGSVRTEPAFTSPIGLEVGNSTSFMTLSNGVLASQISGLKFKSSNPSVAAVTNDGTVTAVTGGTALVSAYATVNGQDFVIGSSEVTVTGEDVIVSINLVDIITAASVAPVLPSEVTALYSSNTTKQVNVIWDAVNPLDYAKGGSFTVNGTVEGISIKAVANVTVTNTAAATLTGANIATTGEQFEVVFGLTGVEGISAQDISLSYDNSKFEFVVAESILNGTSVSEATYNAEEGTIRLIIASAGAINAISGTSDVVRLKFNSIASGTGNIEVTNAMLSSGLGDVIFADTTSKTITVDADKTALIAAISAARNIMNNAVEGISIGMYHGGTKARLSTEIAKAEAISVNVLTAEQVAQAIEDLNRAVNIFQSLVITSSTGDINKIAGHDIGDLGIVSYNYGKKVGDEGWDAIKKADINGDGEIGLYDLAFVAKKILGN